MFVLMANNGLGTATYGTLNTSRRSYVNFLSRDTYDKSPEERKFLHRLDVCLLIYAFFSYLSK
jgi:hypothetical protein